MIFKNNIWLVDRKNHGWLHLMHPSKWEGIQFHLGGNRKDH